MSLLSFDYDGSFHPSAPVVEIEVDGLNRLFRPRSLRAMIDSGADATMLPQQILEAVGASYKETLWMRGVTGSRVAVDLYLVRIRIGTNIVRGVHVVSIPSTVGSVIGRDVLNQLVITLDGPAEATIIDQR